MSDDAVMAVAADQTIYPQASSYSMEDGEPGPLLAERERLYEKHLGWSSWTPASLLDVGAGKGYHLRGWPAATTRTAVEPSEAMWPVIEARDPDARLVRASFLDAVGLEPADLLLMLRVPHHVFFTSYSHLWVIKAAMLCKDRMVIETTFDPQQPIIRDLFDRHATALAAWRERSWLEERFGESHFMALALRFFSLVQEFPSPVPGYRVMEFRRKMPEIVTVGLEVPHLSLDTTTWLWSKTGYPETDVMRYWTVLQLLGEEKHVPAMLSRNGRLTGVRQVHNVMGQAPHGACRAIHLQLEKHLLPIGYLPYDIVPCNVFGTTPIDVECVQPVSVRFDADPERSAMLRGLHYEYLGKMV